MQSSMMFSLLVFTWKYSFGANLVQSVKIISLSWNLVASLIWICRIHCRCWLFSFSTGNTLLWENLVQKKKIISLSWKLVLRLIRIWIIKRWCSLFFVFHWKYTFGANLVQKVKIVSLGWNFIATYCFS